MAIERIGFDIVSNADDILRQLQNVDKQIKSIQKAKLAIEFDDKSALSAGNTLNALNKQLTSLSEQRAELLIDYEQAYGAQDAAMNLAEAFTEVEQRAESAGTSTESAFSRIGSALTSAGGVFSSVGGTIDSLGSSLISLVNPLDGITNSLVAQLSVWSLLQNAIGFVEKNLDSAVSRYSTIQRFPNVLSALGFDEATINRSSDALTKYVSNNPIKLDDLVELTKSIAVITDDLDEATAAAIALNNAFLANGTNSKDRERATNQFVQQLNTGDVDVKSWRTLEETLQVPLKYIAELFGFNQPRDIFRAIQDGKLTFREFEQAFIELGSEGGVLAELASTNMKGLDTSLELLSNSYSVALAGIIDSMDQLFQRVTGKSLDELVDTLRSGVYAVSGAVEEFLEGADPILERVIGFFERVRDRFVAFDWNSLKDGLVEGAQGLYEGFRALLDRLSPVFDVVQGWITNLGGGSFEKGLGLLPATLLEFGLKMKAAGKVLQGAGLAFKGVGALFSLLGNARLASGSFGGSSGGLWSGGGGIAGTITKGALSVVAIAGAIASVAAAVKAIDLLIPDDISGLPDKLILLGEVLGAFGAITLAIGGLVGTTSIGKAIGVAGIASVVGLAIGLQQVAKAVAKIDEAIPDNTNEIKRKIVALEELLDILPRIANPLDILSRIGAALDFSIATNIIRSMVKIGHSLEELGGIEIPRDSYRKIETINNAVEEIANRGFFQIFSSAFTAGDLNIVTDIFDSYKTIASELVALSQYDLAAIEASFEYIETINAAVDTINSYNIADFFTAKIDSSVIENLRNQLNLYGQIAESLTGLSKYNAESLVDVAAHIIPSINDALDLLGTGYSFWDAFVSQKIDKTAIGNLAGLVENYAKAADSLKGLEQYANVDFTNIAEVIIPGIARVLAILHAQGTPQSTVSTRYGDYLAEGLLTQLAAYKDIVAAIAEIGEVDTSVIDNFVNNILPAFDRLVTALNGTEDLSGFNPGFTAGSNNTVKASAGTAAADIARAAADQVKALSEVVRELETISVENIESAIEKIRSINFVVEELALIDATVLDDEGINELKYIIRDVVEIGEDLVALNNFDVSPESVSKVTGALKALVDGLDEITKLPNTPYAKLAIAAITQLLETMASLTDQFGIVGTNYAESLINAYLAVGIPGKMEEDIVEALRVLDTYNPQFTDTGNHYGENLRVAFGKQVERLHEHVNAALVSIRGLAISFYSAGNSLGQSLASGFSTAISGLASSVATQISSIQSTLNSLTVPTLNANVGTGGTVYRATGGQVFAPRGTDTVPAMLTKGEYVMRKSAVSKLGVGVLDKLNSMNIDGALRNLYGSQNHHARIKTPISTVVNNKTYNVTNNANITQNMSGSNQDYNISQALGKMGYA